MARDLVGYGRDRPQGTWPNGSRIAISLVINYEEGGERYFPEDGAQEPMIGEMLIQSTDRRDIYGESAYEYGSRVGVWRLLKIAEDREVPVTFFAAGRALEKNPAVATAIAQGGHESCGHGYRWIEAHHLSRDEQREDIRKCIEVNIRLVGTRPLGWASRWANADTRALLVEEGGFVYDSGAFNDDVPYTTDVNGRPLLVVPYSREVNDIRFWRGSFMTAGQFLEYAQTSFDCLYAESEEQPLMMTFGVHSRISGTPGRARALADFIDYARGFPGVWFTRRIDIARAWQERAGAEPD